MKLKRRNRWKLLWADLLPESSIYCETPKHRGMEIPARYSCAFVDLPDMDDFVQSMCYDCVLIMATDLGTTPEAGKRGGKDNHG